MPHWMIVSPRISDKFEEFHCVASVDAPTRDKAKAAALKHVNMREWLNEARSDGISPFNGLTVSRTLCPHGHCYCQNCNDPCSECEAESEAEYQAQVKEMQN